jgi:hypothetical protein
MKRVITALLLTAMCASFSYAHQGAPTGKDWQKIGNKAKEQLVSSFIQQMKKEGVTISKSAVFYCKKLDSLYVKKPNLLTEPVWKVLKTAMIMERDWSVRGKNPDAVAKEWLGDKLYAKWKEKYAAQNPR